MGAFLGTALVLLALAVLIYPFLSRKKYPPPPDTLPERLRAERLRIYRQIADLEADWASGDLSEDDYQAQLKELRTAAARVLRNEGRRAGIQESEAALEREIQAARQSRRGPPEGGDRV